MDVPGPNYKGYCQQTRHRGKVLKVLIDTCLRASLQMHDVLHSSSSGRGQGAAIMELKLAQELASIYQDPLFLVFMDLRKAYDTVDR